MGQNMMAVVYGVVMTSELASSLRDDPDDPDSDMDDIYDAITPDRVEMGEDFGCLAVTVLTGGAPGRNETMLEGTVFISEIEIKFPDEVARARKNWGRLAEWAKTERSVILPYPALILTIVERA